MSAGSNAWRASSRPTGIRTSGGTLVGARFGGHDGLDAPAHREVADVGHAARVNGGDEVVLDLIGDVFVKNPAVAKFDQVILERLQFDAARVGRIRDPNLAEVGETGLRADARKLRT